ncbi:MAG: hypothetical protein RL322_1380 [Pseudomonadota bacterium]
MIRIQGLVLSRGSSTLLDEADAAISAGERVALVGLNGSGKSTLFAALAGELSPDGGQIEQPYRQVTLLRQSAPSGAIPAWRYLLDGDHRLCAAEQALEHAQHHADGLVLAQAHADWLDAGGHDARPRAMALLSGLGFDTTQAEQSVDALSGGWRMRLNLARALFSPGDLLLLDEPTNHLDLDAIVWLERWLQRLDCTQMIVSHDRDFLDRVAQSTLHIDQGKLVRYAGGYSEFERLRAERQQQAVREQRAIAEQSARLRAFIDRFRAQATRARQVQSRVKALERMAEVAPIRAMRGVDIRLEDPGDSPDPLMSVEDLSVGYGASAIVKGVQLQVRRGARLGILGRNGAGKSTLIRTLVGELSTLGGEIRSARNLRIGYFDQQTVDRMDPQSTPLSLFVRIAGDTREQALRDVLGRLGFRGEDVTRPIATLSGGERARLSLGLIAWQRPHLLILDEPTNHLDAQTRDSLADAIAAFEGAVLLVSHDRYLLRASVDQLLWIDRGRMTEYEGDLDDYAQWVLKSRETSSDERDPAAHAEPGPAGAVDRRSERRRAAQRRTELAAATRRIDERLKVIETRLHSTQAELAQLDAALQDESARDGSGRAERFEQLGRSRSALTTEAEHLESEWFELQTEREAIVAAHPD